MGEIGLLFGIVEDFELDPAPGWICGWILEKFEELFGILRVLWIGYHVKDILQGLGEVFEGSWLVLVKDFLECMDGECKLCEHVWCIVVVGVVPSSEFSCDYRDLLEQPAEDCIPEMPVEFVVFVLVDCVDV